MPMPGDMGLFRHSFEKRRFQVIAGLLPRSGCERVLDAGAGSGWLSEILSNRGHRVYAVDIGLDSIRRASARLAGQKGNVHFTQADVYRLPFPDRSFDAVVVSEIVEHLDHPGPALREIARLLRRGGCVIVSTPYRENIEYARCIHCNEKTPVNAHLHSFTGEDMKQLLSETGFTVERLVLFASRPGERIGLAGLTCFAPHMVWRALDELLCRMLGRQSFMALRAVRNDE